jgi:hypothetical protein
MLVPCAVGTPRRNCMRAGTQQRILKWPKLAEIRNGRAGNAVDLGSPSEGSESGRTTTVYSLAAEPRRGDPGTGNPERDDRFAVRSRLTLTSCEHSP